MKAKGFLFKNEEGQICLKMSFSSDSEVQFDVPIEELFEEMLDKRVQIKALPLKTFEEANLE